MPTLPAVHTTTRSGVQGCGSQKQHRDSLRFVRSGPRVVRPVFQGDAVDRCALPGEWKRDNDLTRTGTLTNTCTPTLPLPTALGKNPTPFLTFILTLTLTPGASRERGVESKIRRAGILPAQKHQSFLARKHAQSPRPRLQLQGIPMLVVLNGKGELVTTQGRGEVGKYFGSTPAASGGTKPSFRGGCTVS